MKFSRHHRRPGGPAPYEESHLTGVATSRCGHAPRRAAAVLLALASSALVPSLSPAAPRADETRRAAKQPTSPVLAAPIYSFTAKTLDGEEVHLSSFAGKVLLVVNTASKCGFTPQYKDLEELHRKYKDRGFSVLAFPSNDFGGQEPGTDPEIKRFCSLRYDVTFPVFRRQHVTGPEAQPIFTYLTTGAGEEFEGEVKWNFEKFLIDRTGTLRARFGSSVNPLSGRIVKEVEALTAG